MSNRHPSAYPKNPGLSRESTIPNNSKEFLKTLANAKTKAEEEYRSTDLPKITLFPWQVDILNEQFPESTAIHDWLSANFDVQIQDGPDVRTVRAKIYADLNRAEEARQTFHYWAPKRSSKTWLGSQIEQRERERLQRGNRVAEMREVPGIRGLGYSTDQAWIDEPYYSTEIESGPSHWSDFEEGHAALEEWLQRRGICYRASSCGVA